MDLTTNGVVITDAIKFVQTNKGKLAAAASAEEDNNGEKFQRNQTLMKRSVRRKTRKGNW